MQPFGTDVDEEPMWRGADVVGLDSQGRLELNLTSRSCPRRKPWPMTSTTWSPRRAIPGQRADNSYLTASLAGTYYQGAFRFFNPCPAVGHHFYVEVYESDREVPADHGKGCLRTFAEAGSGGIGV